MKSSAVVETKMQNCLVRLGIPLKVLWIPKVDSTKHGEINSNCIFIYDKTESEAWLTFQHEVYEFKFKEVTFAYRTLINSLIETIEKIAYERKEKFIEFLPMVSEIITKERANKNESMERTKKREKIGLGFL